MVSFEPPLISEAMPKPRGLRASMPRPWFDTLC